MTSRSSSLKSLLEFYSLNLLSDEGAASSLPSDSPPGVSASNSTCCSCHEISASVKTFSCSHILCKGCFEREQDKGSHDCPECLRECSLISNGVARLLTEQTPNFVEEYCTSCRNQTSNIVARCYDCSKFLCSTCVLTHQSLYCFEGHKLQNLSSADDLVDNCVKDLPLSAIVFPCQIHKSGTLEYFCKACDTVICEQCALLDHSGDLHDIKHLSEVASKLEQMLDPGILECKSKITNVEHFIELVEDSSRCMLLHYQKAMDDIKDTFKFYMTTLEERKEDLLKELESAFSLQQTSLKLYSEKACKILHEASKAIKFYEETIKQTGPAQGYMYKHLIDKQNKVLASFDVATIKTSDCCLQFVSNQETIKTGVVKTFGYIRNHLNMLLERQLSITRPSLVSGELDKGIKKATCTSNVPFEKQSSSSLVNSKPQSRATHFVKQFSSSSSDTFKDNGLSRLASLKKKPSELVPAFHHEKSLNYISPLCTFLSPLLARKRMFYCRKVGEFGSLEGQFSEPSGVAVDGQSNIIVADSKNHRIQIFDLEGRFRYQFGHSKRGEGQMFYPTRVAVMKISGDIVLIERSPVSQVQIYNQYGQFVRKFGGDVLQHPRGVTVDNAGRIIVVECKIMRVIIFDQEGIQLKTFECSNHLVFPNGIAVNDKEEIFISDNKAHSVKVFNYEGIFLRQIGCVGITDYPIGVGINSEGHVVIADNHNNFNLTIFTQEGEVVAAFESKVKHAVCFDFAVIDESTVVLASKDYRLYVYRYYL